MVKQMIVGIGMMGLVLAVGAPAWATPQCPGVGNDCSQDTTIQGGSAAAVATGGAATAGAVGVGKVEVRTGPVSQKVEVKQSVTQKTDVKVGQKQKIEGSGNSDVKIEGDKTEIPAQAPAIFSPNLTASPEACMGSVSGGGGAGFNGISFGFNMGMTWKNEDCERRAYTREIRVMPGLTEAQKGAIIAALLTQNGAVEQAFVNAGVAIPGKAGVQTSQVVPATSSTVIQGGVKQEKRDYKDNRAEDAAPTGYAAQLQTALYFQGLASAHQGM